MPRPPGWLRGAQSGATREKALFLVYHQAPRCTTPRAAASLRSSICCALLVPASVQSTSVGARHSTLLPARTRARLAWR